MKSYQHDAQFTLLSSISLSYITQRQIGIKVLCVTVVFECTICLYMGVCVCELADMKICAITFELEALWHPSSEVCLAG